uniref:Uncharacterized protein n=1 Tax=Romanomermis culicivorax TaxID=13658 RepID=A0A915L010_ROMCU
MLKMAGDVSLVTSYRPKETVTVTAAVAVVLAPPACFAAQESSPGILIDSALFIVHHQRDAGHLVNGLGQEIPAFKMGAAQRAIRSRIAHSSQHGALGAHGIADIGAQGHLMSPQVHFQWHYPRYTCR